MAVYREFDPERARNFQFSRVNVADIHIHMLYHFVYFRETVGKIMTFAVHHILHSLVSILELSWKG